MRFRTSRMSDSFRTFGSWCRLFDFDASLPSVETLLVVSTVGMVGIVVNGFPSYIQCYSQTARKGRSTTQLT